MLRSLRLIASLGVLTLLGMGCSKTIHPRFEESNQLFVEETVKEINLGAAVKSYIPAGSKVALVSLERSITLDRPMLALIEDQLVSSLVRAGYNTIERDAHAVIDIMEEGTNDNYSLYARTPLARAAAEADQVEIDIAGIEYSDAPPYVLSKTNLAAADYLISYRILESGIIYRDKDSKLDTREGLVRLHVRIQRTSDGSILMADNLAGTKQDDIRKELVAQLADFHYTYYPFEYPLQPRERVKTATKAVTTSNRYFFAEFLAGRGAIDDESNFSTGMTLGWGSPEFGRMGVNFTMTAETETYNVVLQYEKPLRFWEEPKFLRLTPKIGAGYIGSKYVVSEGEWLSYEEEAGGLGIALGGSVEFDMTKTLYLKGGFTHFLGISEDEASNSALSFSLGFRM